MNRRHLLLIAVNAAGLPGAGTWMSGRRRLGAVQMAVSLLLLGATLASMALLLALLGQRGVRPSQIPNMILENSPLLQDPGEWTALALALIFVLLYLLNLAWALSCSRPHPPPLPHPQTRD